MPSHDQDNEDFRALTFYLAIVILLPFLFVIAFDPDLRARWKPDFASPPSRASTSSPAAKPSDRLPSSPAHLPAALMPLSQAPAATKAPAPAASDTSEQEAYAFATDLTFHPDDDTLTPHGLGYDARVPGERAAIRDFVRTMAGHPALFDGYRRAFRESMRPIASGDEASASWVRVARDEAAAAALRRVGLN